MQNAELLRRIQDRLKLFGEPGTLLPAVAIRKVAEIQVLRGLLIVLIATRLKKTGNRGARILTAETIRGRRRRGRSLKYRDGKRERECPDLHPPYGDAIGEPSRVCNATELVRNRPRKSRVKSSVDRSLTVAARFGGCAKSATYRAARVSERSALGFSHRLVSRRSMVRSPPKQASASANPDRISALRGGSARTVSSLSECRAGQCRPRHRPVFPGPRR
jgi:hypothetical protein